MDDLVALHREETAAIARSTHARQREFATGRACARKALSKLGFAPGPIPIGSHGEPLWPPEAVGSITHCAGYRACAVARASEVVALGIDAELNDPLPHGLIADIADATEIRAVARLGGERSQVRWDRLLFSAKEAVYKAWFPLTQRWLGFHDVTVALHEPGGFSARLLVRGPEVHGQRLIGFSGRWTLEDGLLIAAVAYERPLAA